ncbi:MAG: GNAT family N-acetyltransferase [Actinomycetota bacterium]
MTSAPRAAVVRPARPEDAPAIAAIAAATFPDASPASLPRAAVEAHIALHLSEAAVAAWIADPERIVLVGAAADAPETLLGYAMYETAATPEAPVTERLGDVPAGHLSKLYVLAEGRGTGLAEALVHDGVERLRRLGFRHVWLGTNAQNTRANRFYERLGFATIGARQFVVGGERVEDDWVRLLTAE